MQLRVTDHLWRAAALHDYARICNLVAVAYESGLKFHQHIAHITGRSTRSMIVKDATIGIYLNIASVSFPYHPKKALIIPCGNPFTAISDKNALEAIQMRS